MKRHRAARLALGTAMLGCACSSGPEIKDVYCDPPRFEAGFSSRAWEGVVITQASLDPNHESELGIDLLEEGIVPVKLSIQLKGSGVNERIIQVEPARWDARLYLLDGTVLPWVEVEKVVEDLDDEEAQQVRRHAFRPQLVEEKPLEGYVFFALDGKRFELDGRKVNHVEKGLARPLRLDDSLLAFNLSQENTIEPYFVGIRP